MIVYSGLDRKLLHADFCMEGIRSCTEVLSWLLVHHTIFELGMRRVVKRHSYQSQNLYIYISECVCVCVRVCVYVQD
jgi:hypothetical protein